MTSTETGDVTGRTEKAYNHDVVDRVAPGQRAIAGDSLRGSPPLGPSWQPKEAAQGQTHAAARPSA